jgi:hypothetical protein
MGKPRAPRPPDYAAAATAQGQANTNSAIATNFLNQPNQVGPYGSMNYTYDYAGGHTLADGTVIPRTTATTTLSPDQQTLLDQNSQLSISLNNLAQQGVGYVGETANNPIDQNSLPGQVTSVTPAAYRDSVGDEDYSAHRDRITDAMMQRLQPYIDRDREALATRQANQGITQGSKPWEADTDVFNRGVNDQRIAALLAGDQEQQMMWDQQQRGLENYNRAQEATFGQGLAGGQFTNQARAQAIQEADYFRNQPLNMLNALRSGNQTNMPQFGNVSAGSQIQPAPVYAAANDQYQAALDAYRTRMQGFTGMLSGIGGIGTSLLTGGVG